MGGKSLEALKILNLIRKNIGTVLDASILFASTSIRQLVQMIEPLFPTKNKL
jgi:hypothetical protein